MAPSAPRESSSGKNKPPPLPVKIEMRFASPLSRYEQQAGIGLAVRKHLLAQRGVIASAAIRKPGPKLSAADLTDLDRLVKRQTRRLAEIG